MRPTALPRSPRARDLRGFSIIELLVVAVLGSVILSAAYGLIAADSRRIALATGGRPETRSASGETDLLSAIRMLAPEGAPVPVTAPLRAGTGVGFSFLDLNGGATTVAAEVRQIVVTLPSGQRPSGAPDERPLESRGASRR
jgi:prepilin-type N-terminal cleavage/methylation domain-containing protein